jgi:hypothetical protein
MPVRTPLSSGRTTPTALAAPVEDGMRLATAALHDAIGMSRSEESVN